MQQSTYLPWPDATENTLVAALCKWLTVPSVCHRFRRQPAVVACQKDGKYRKHMRGLLAYSPRFRDLPRSAQMGGS